MSFDHSFLSKNFLMAFRMLIYLTFLFILRKCKLECIYIDFELVNLI